MPTDNQREYMRNYYQQNKENFKQTARVNNARYRQRNREKIFAYLLDHPCCDCGESDPVVLQFDHVHGKKIAHIGRMVGTGVAWARIVAEIEKCEVVCANCHWRRTAKRGGWTIKLMGI